MQACFRGGLKSPRIIQEAVDHSTMLSLVSCRMGVSFVSDATQWRIPDGVRVLRVEDLEFPLLFALVWRKDNASPLLAKFVADVRRMISGLEDGLRPSITTYPRRAKSR